MATIIAPERPDTIEAQALIAELDAQMAPIYPAKSRHGYSVDKLLREGVAFFVTRYDGAAAGCGGVQLYDDYAEIKRMYVRPAFRGRGLARLMLNQLVAYAASRGIERARLETGIHQREAIGLYEAEGYRCIPPFGDYVDDPLSVFFEKHLGR